jgi:hemerythrin superfamily protein
MKQKYMTQETAAHTRIQYIRNGLQSSTENERTEELKGKLVHGQFYWTLTDHQQIEKSPWPVVYS